MTLQKAERKYSDLDNPHDVIEPLEELQCSRSTGFDIKVVPTE